MALALGATTMAPDGGADAGVEAPDAAGVPVVIPGLRPAVASLMAPELVADAGQAPQGVPMRDLPFAPDGGPTPVVAPHTLSVYNVDLPAEAALTAGLFGLYLMIDVIVKPTLANTPSCLNMTPDGHCNPADLNALDRYAVGKSSTPWLAFSDVALAASMIIPVLYLGLESLALPTDEPWGDFFKDALVITESLALTASLETVLKFTVRRPRPANYVPTSNVSGEDSQLSMPSGHTAIVSAATTALTTTVFLRHPDSKLRYVVLVAGVALSLLTGVARVESGQHFPTDVITGLLIGGASGFAIPFLHKKQSPVMPSVAYNPATGATVFSVVGALPL